MIDWGKLGPANSPTPAAPSIAPVAPAAPGSVPTIKPLDTGATAGRFSDGQLSDSERNMTQDQVDKLSIGDKLGRGVDTLGNFMFGEKSALHNTIFEDIAGAPAAAVDWAVVKPLEVAAKGLHAIPLGGLPGGADETFIKLGDWAKANDPQLYAQWQATDAAAAGQWGAGDLHADFNTEALKYIDDQHYDTKLGTSPTLAIGKAGVGSLGDALSDAVGGWLGLLGNEAQKALGNTGIFDPSSARLTYEDSVKEFAANPDALPPDNRYAMEQLAAGKFTEQQARDYVDKNSGGRNRIDEAAARIDRGADASDVEKQAVEAYRSGKWSLDHAETWLVTHGQSVTRDPLGQIIGSVLTDPLTYATVGAGAVSNVGKVGLRIAEAGGEAANAYEKLATTISAVQQSQLGPAFRIARGLVDPLAVYKPSSVARAVTDLRNGVALEAFQRAYGPQTVTDMRAIGREFEKAYELDSATASYSIDQANLMIARNNVRNMLDQGLGEELVHSNVDDVIEPLAHNASRDAVTQTTDHMMATAKNTFTAEEEAHLAGRLAATYGKDVPYWQKRMATMSFDLKTALHATTYKMTEKEFEEAKALIDVSQYSGDLPLRNMVLMTADTLDNITAEAIIANIRDVLKADPENVSGRISAATDQWNAAARRYPAMANMGYATGGKEQVERLANELDKALQSGGITRRATEEELGDTQMRPIRDMLDRHSVRVGVRTPEQQAAAKEIAMRDAEASIAAKGWVQPSTEKFFASIRKASAVTKSNGRKIGETVFIYPKGEYAKMRLFLSADGKAGFAIKSDGDLVSVFNGGDVRGAIKDVVPDLHALGATKLDAFDESGRLPDLYAQGGFKTTRREPWNPSYAPPGWTGDTPDVVYMEHPGVNQTGYQPLWKVGFRPDEEVAWGLKRDVNTGLYVVDRDPTISHVIDAVPGRQPFSDTTRNVLGQIIGRSKAERLNKPIESIEAMSNTMRDVITGRRLVLNIEKRFERSTFDAGLPKPISKEIFAKAREVAGLDYSTVRGIKPDNLWNAIHDIIPRNLVLKDGSTVNIHIVMDHLLKAAEGDLRVMGVSSVLSQRMRNALRHAGLDPANWAGQMTVTMYNKLRYSQPTFLIQRITDSPYYSVLYGVTPVGKGALKGEDAELAAITENIGRTGMARDFSMDMPEFATRSNFTAGIKSHMQQMGLKENKLQRIIEAPDVIIANNMTHMLHARLGDIVRGSLDNLAAAAEKADPAFRADMLAAGEELQRSFADWRLHYSEIAGRVLDDNEVGFRYIKDQLSGWRRHVVNADGTIDMQKLIHEGERSLPSSIADIGPIRPDSLAQELGYADGAALRRDVTGHLEKINGEFLHVPGEHDMPWLEEQLRETLGAHPDYARRASAYFGETWDDFWHRLSKSVDAGGLDISPHYAKEAQDAIAILARDRSMDPWEYLSGVMATNLGPGDLNTAMGRLAAFLRGGAGKSAEMSPADWGAYLRSQIDPSGQQTLLDAIGGRTGAAGSIETKMAAGDVAGSQADNVAEGAAKGGNAAGGALKASPMDEYKIAKATHDDAMQAATDKAQQGIDDFAAKWNDASKNHLRMEKDLTELEAQGYDTGEAMDKLDDYRNVDRGDFDGGADGREEYQQAREDAWQEILDSVDAMDPAPVADALTEHLVEPTLPTSAKSAAPASPTLEFRAPEPPPAAALTDDEFYNAIEKLLKERVANGPHANPDVEGIIQHIAKVTQTTLKGAAKTGVDEGMTRSTLRSLVQDLPIQQAVPFNRTQALVVSLLKDKINDAQQDIFRLAEMQTKRSVLERSLNHPLFALYPASYMWGKVLPETVKFLGKNPYASTYVIGDVSRSIAIQREYNPDMESMMNGVDRSSAAFLLDYLTPGLPWSDHSARMSPMVRDLLKGAPEKIWDDELATVDPHRWIAQVADTAKEGLGAVEHLGAPPVPPQIGNLQSIVGGASAGGTPTAAPTQITGPVQASGLASILSDDLSRLQSILLGGQPAGG